MSGDFNPLKITITEELLKSHSSVPVNLFNAFVGHKEELDLLAILRPWRGWKQQKDN